jgi:hypothetical protein
MATSHSFEVPFPARTALCTARLRIPHCPTLQIHHVKSPPSPIDKPEESLSYVPGEPTVDLSPAEVHGFIDRELYTPVLDELYTRLWLVARKSGGSIDALHRQRIKGRNIMPTEDPKLHLVWHHDRIYVKPIPLCLLNHDFWAAYLSPSVDAISSQKSVSQAKEKDSAPEFNRSVAVGFMRSYAYLVQHRSDFILARECHLIPGDVDWISWSVFIAHFRHIEDDRVAKRYHYGQLRLSRMNWAIRIFRPQKTNIAWFYEIPHWSTSLYIEQIIAPLIFAFASLSLVLSSMQVVLSVPVDGLGFEQLGAPGMQAIRSVFWVFSIIVLLLSGVVWILLLVIPFSVIGWQLSWGFRNRGKAAFEGAVGA